MTPEGKVKAGVKKLLRDNKIWFYMPVQNGMGVVGIPDIIACANGKFVAIETKAPGKIASLTPNQQSRLSEIAAAGGKIFVVDNIATAKQLLVAAGIIKEQP